MKSRYRNNNGFTLIEILTVMLIMGLVIASVYSIYINSKKNANTTVEVGDLQQNMRVAMEMLTADIRMAGFLIPDDADAVFSAPPAALSDANFLALNLATSTGVYARVPLGPGTFSAETDIGVSTGMAAKFTADDGIRIITPAFPNSATDLTADEVTGVDTGTSEITLKPGATITVNDRDVLMQATPDDLTAFPVVVRYRLIDSDLAGMNADGMNLLQRSVNNNTYETIATNITSVTLTPLPAGYAAMSDIKAIGIAIIGTTGITATAETKTRELQTVVKIENNDEV